MSMDKELKARWLAALRSGEYLQGQKHLEHEGKYCCLGVLAKLVGAEFLHGQEIEGDDSDEFQTCYLRYNGDTSDSEELGNIGYKLGLSANDEGTLIILNDGNSNGSQPKPFSEIADWIEKNVPVKEPLL